MKRPILGLAVGLVALTPTALAAAEGTIKIGFAMAESGWMEVYDTQTFRGASVRINEINAAGGLLGKQLEIVRRDTKTDKAEGARAGQDLVDQKVDLMAVSVDFNMGSPAALVAERAGIISIFAAADDVKAGLQGVGPLSFNVTGSNAVASAATIGEWAYNKLGSRKAYLLLDTTIDVTKSYCRGFDWIFKQLDGASVVDTDTFKNDDPSIASQVTRIKGAAVQPDVIALCSYPPGGASVIRQLRAAGIDVPIITGNPFDGTFWLESVPNISKVYISTPGSVRGDDPRPAVNEFAKSYEKAFNIAPDQQSAISGYVMIDLWARAVEKAGTTDAQKVKAVLETFNEEPTIANPRTFTPELHINNKPDLLIEEAKGSKLEQIGNWKLTKDVPIDVLLGK